MNKLSDLISVAERFARSVNLDRDIDLVEPLESYIVTARALNVIERISFVAATGNSGGAWSLTGPYGSGKSSLALLIDAAFGPASITRDIAWNLIDEASPEVAKLIQQSHERARTTKFGFHRGLATAQRESLSNTLLRALNSAAIRSYGKNPSIRQFKAKKTLNRAIKDVTVSDPNRTPSPSAIMDIARCLATNAPLLLIIDEFGKNLESIQDDQDSDPYLLQQLSEAGQGLGLPIFILTLQHQSFQDYFSNVNASQRREWSKVQGRFEEIPYIESPEQSRGLIGAVFQVRDSKLKHCIESWANNLYIDLRRLGITSFSSPEFIALCYPLHPLTTLVLPELCNRFGQHERTMFSFLTSADRASAASFLVSTTLPQKKQIPSVGLDLIYDFFVANGTLANVFASQSGRWIELATRIRDVHGLTECQLKLAKSIAILNLISTSGTLRASRQVLNLTGLNISNNLQKLESLGVTIYRTHADEYRVWQGSGVDINELLNFEQTRVKKLSLSEVLGTIDSPSPVVAARHSAERDTLRVFCRRYADSEELIEPLSPSSPFDGEVLLVVGDKIPKLKIFKNTLKPVICAIPEKVRTLERFARELLAVVGVLNLPSVKNDIVASSELRERVALAQANLNRVIHTTFCTTSCQWILLNDSREIKLISGKGSAPLSEAADRVYKWTPLIRNEMLNRTALTTQGAKARRMVIEAMIKNGNRLGLGFEGYGPEVAIVEVVLKRTGMHSFDSRNNVMVFRKPTDKTIQPAWKIVVDEFNRAKSLRVNVNEIFIKLISPPIGMKAGVVPLFVTIALLAYRDEIAIYEHGTFKPLLTPEISERMVKNPRHFDVKHFASTSGARRQVIESLAECFNLRPSFRKHRVANVLTIVVHLVSQVSKLDNFTRRTNNLELNSIEVRNALLRAVEPDKLLFDALPKAVGCTRISENATTYESIGLYSKKLQYAVSEIVNCYDRMLAELRVQLFDICAESNRQAISGQAMALNDEVLEPKTKMFIRALANDKFDDESWIKSVATVVMQKAPSEWTDEDHAYFHHAIKRRVAAFRRLVALHAEFRAFSNESFVPMRVTITKPDGNEFVDLVSLDDSLRDDADEALKTTLKKLTRITGSERQARKAILALLTDYLLSDMEEVRRFVA